MAQTSISITVEGEKQMSRRLLTDSNQVKDFHRPLSTINRNLRSDINRNFTMRGGLYGGWRPRKKNYPWPLLEKTGKLRHGFDSDVGRTELVIRNLTDYFKYHQSRRPRSRLPRRVMMKIRNQDAREIQREFQRYIQEVTRR